MPRSVAHKFSGRSGPLDEKKEAAPSGKASFFSKQSVEGLPY